MNAFIKYLEKELDINFIESLEPQYNKNTFSINSDGKVISLYISEVGEAIQNMELLLPLADHLKELSIPGCEISKIDSLGEFQKLEFLDLSVNPISDFKAIEKLTNLKKLELFATNLESEADLEFLHTLQNLEYLNIGHTELTSIKGVDKLKKLKTLILNYAKIKSFKDLQKMPSLTYLDLYNSNSFYDSGLESLAVFENIKALNLSGCPILTTQGLGKLTELEQLFLDDTRVEEVVSLDSLKNLKLLSLDNTHLFNIQGLEGLENLRLLSLAKNEDIRVIEGFEGLKNVEIIHLGCSEITRVEKEHFKGITKDCIINFSYEDKLTFIDQELPSNITIAIVYNKYGNYTHYTEDVDKFIDDSKARLIKAIKERAMKSQH